MKKISVFTLLLTLVAGGVFAQTLYNSGGSWKNTGHWRIEGTGDKANAVPTSSNDVNIVADMKVDDNASAASVTIKNGKTLTVQGKTLTCSNIIVENGTLNLNDDKAKVAGSITVGSGGMLKFQKKGEVTGDIILKDGANYDLKNLQSNEFGGTLIFEAGVVIDETKLPAFLKPSSNPANVMCIKPIQRGWNFIGLPLSSDIAPLAASDAPAMWALRFNYEANEWSENYLHYIEGGQRDALAVGNGIFVYLADNSYNIRLGYGTGVTDDVQMSYPYTGTRSAADGRWFALANPYMKNLDINGFVSANPNKIQGVGVYLFDGTSFGSIQTSGTIPVGEGFFVNMEDGQTGITFNYPSSAKSKGAEREFVRVSVATNGYKVPVMFAQNDDATDGYDIYDANKMFGNGTVAEPYLICEGIELCKEEVLSSSYTATMNIKSSESRSVEIVADNIPEGYSLTLIDGALEVVMNQGDVYTTDIARGRKRRPFQTLDNQEQCFDSRCCRSREHKSCKQQPFNQSLRRQECSYRSV